MYKFSKIAFMDIEILKGVGLTEPQARTYLKLLELGEASPPELAEELGETRTNMYSILEQLQAKNIALRLDSGKKLVYRPAHPINISTYVERRRNVILNWEYKLNSVIPGMVKTYFATTEQPAVRFFQGREALERIYEEIIDDRQDLIAIIPEQEHEFMGEKFIDDFVKQRVKKKLKAHILVPKLPNHKYNLRNDKAHLIVRHWYSPELYSAPVEINIYGDKVAYLSFGNEVFGTIIHSPQIAQAMRELFSMIADSTMGKYSVKN